MIPGYPAAAAAYENRTDDDPTTCDDLDCDECADQIPLPEEDQ